MGISAAAPGSEWPECLLKQLKGLSMVPGARALAAFEIQQAKLRNQENSPGVIHERRGHESPGWLGASLAAKERQFLIFPAAKLGRIVADSKIVQDGGIRKLFLRRQPRDFRRRQAEARSDLGP